MDAEFALWTFLYLRDKSTDLAACFHQISLPISTHTNITVRGTKELKYAKHINICAGWTTLPDMSLHCLSLPHPIPSWQNRGIIFTHTCFRKILVCKDRLRCWGHCDRLRHWDSNLAYMMRPMLHNVVLPYLHVDKICCTNDRETAMLTVPLMHSHPTWIWERIW